MFGLLKSLRRPRIVIERNALTDIADAQYAVVVVPFHGTSVTVKLRRLTQAQIQACGDFSLIQTFEDKVRAKSTAFTMREVSAYSERYHSVAEAALVAPTYTEILTIFDGDEMVERARRELDELEEKLLAAPGGGMERAALQEEIESTRMWCDLLLPADFLSAVMAFALGMDTSDIDAVTEEALLDAAILADRGRDNPADHLDGRFTPFMRDDINRRAWVLHNEWVEKRTPPEVKRRRKKVLSGN